MTNPKPQNDEAVVADGLNQSKYWPPECKITKEDYRDEETIYEFPIDLDKIVELERKGILEVFPIRSKEKDVLGIYVRGSLKGRINRNLNLEVIFPLLPIGIIEIIDNKFGDFEPQEYKEYYFELLAEIMKYGPKKEGEKYEKKEGEYSIDPEENAQISLKDLFGPIEVDCHKFIEALRKWRINVVYEGSDIFFEMRPYIQFYNIDEIKNGKVKLTPRKLKGEPEELLDEIVRIFS